MIVTFLTIFFKNSQQNARFSVRGDGSGSPSLNHQVDFHEAEKGSEKPVQNEEEMTGFSPVVSGRAGIVSGDEKGIATFRTQIRCPC